MTKVEEYASFARLPHIRLYFAAKPVEQLDLLFAVLTDRMVLGQALDHLTHARADLVREVRRRRPDERVDVLPGRLGLH